MRDTLYIVGRGVSCHLFDWPDDIDTLAISGAVDRLPYLPTYWCGIDAPHTYAHLPWFLASDVPKYVIETRFLRRWADQRNVQWVPYGFEGHPNWSASGPIYHPQIGRMFSLFPAVQIGHRLGYKRLAFVGVDLLEDRFDVIVDAMRDWYYAAKLAGLEWVTVGEVSRLIEFMPVGREESERIAI